MHKQATLSVLAILAMAAAATAEDWTRFRGPDGKGLAEKVKSPVQWGPDRNVRWKTELPGPGASSPAVRDGRIYVSAYSGYNRWEKGRDFSDFKLHALCLGADGKVIWTREMPSDQQQLRGGHGGTRWHGYATATPLVDDLGVYISYGNNGFYALDHEGKQRWKKDLGPRKHGWGHGASPIRWGELVIINASIEAQQLQAYDAESGLLEWATEIGSMSWSTPVVAKVGSQEQLVVNVRGGIAGFSPGDGKKLWQLPGGRDYQTTSPVLDGDVVYYSLRNTHGGSCTQAIRLQENAEPEVLWKNDRLGAVSASPLVWKGKLYWAMVDSRTPRRQRGFYCADAGDGEILYHAQPDPMPTTVYASPILAGGKIYYQALQAGAYVLKAGGQFKPLAHNAWDQDGRRATSTPVPLGDDALLIRMDEMLYCAGEGE
jgi:outer membrane protein assembly factor BamB